MSNFPIEDTVTVVIPLFNNETTIEATLNSVRKQTELSLIKEIIIVNDGSTDRSKEIVENYISTYPEMRISLINKKNGGVSSARNVGMRLAESKYVAFLDSDDIWLPEKTATQMKVFHDNPHIDFLGCNYNNKELKILLKKVDTLYRATIKDLCIKSFPVTPSVIFKREIIDGVGYFDEEQRYAEDGGYFFKICNSYNYYHLPEQLVICGYGKPEFGYSGLSANLKEMHKGTIRNISMLKNEQIISPYFYSVLRLFYFLKYLRRILITKLRFLRKAFVLNI